MPPRPEPLRLARAVLRKVYSIVLARVLLNAEGLKNVPSDTKGSRFIYLCPNHFELGIGKLEPNDDLSK